MYQNASNDLDHAEAEKELVDQANRNVPFADFFTQETRDAVPIAKQHLKHREECLRGRTEQREGLQSRRLRLVLVQIIALEHEIQDERQDQLGREEEQDGPRQRGQAAPHGRRDEVDRLVRPIELAEPQEPKKRPQKAGHADHPGLEREDGAEHLLQHPRRGDGQVQAIPRILEIAAPQRQDLERDLEREDGAEREVAKIEHGPGARPGLLGRPVRPRDAQLVTRLDALVLRLRNHDEHVQHDQR
mmetsp:Transcript_37315/g.97347  ORF Transcript_37315/g.97347 Transcript_37315/m.97347 type:complete len:245 (-) Transcript_37315:282-1016(-)